MVRLICLRWRKHLLGALMLSGVLMHTSCGASRKQAAEAEARGEYLRAAMLYRQLYRRSSPRALELRAYYAWHTAEAYRALRQSQRALNFYRSAERYGYPDSLLLLRLGQVTQMVQDYPEALRYYQRYLAVDSLSHLARIGIEGCKLALADTADVQRYRLQRADSWNSGASDYAPTFAPDGSQIYFGSNRGREGDKSDITGELDGNLYVLSRDQHGLWSSKPDTLPGALNTIADEGTPSLTADGSTMYYTLAERSEQYVRTAQIWKATKSGEQGWSKGNLVDIWRDSTTMAAHPSISPSGKTLFFVSNASGGYGGKDIYRVSIENNSYGAVENLGLPINSPADELFPHSVSDSVLYFSSDGHPGYGGLDVYKAILLPSGQWHVEHLPRPLNSHTDDLGIAFDPRLDQRPGEENLAARGIISSSRDDGRGRPHLYHFSLPQIETIIEGYVMDRDDYAIAGATVRLVGNNKDGASEVVATTKQDGSYRIRAKGDVSYVMLASAPGYLNQYARFRTEATKRSELYAVDFHLASREESESLRHVYYAFDSAELLPESAEPLGELVRILQENPEIRIELSAHADRHGTQDYNQRLSDRRAQSVVDYLIGQGISADRLVARGYGQQSPLKVPQRQAEQHPYLKEGDELTAEFVAQLNEEQQAVCDALNRRTEFIVLRDEKE
ncbi:MAG: OmpA family protein [Porphyromonadaceae bacterium]|nr:OmpA family protein [Porphyromonadaceae bacterium]